MKKEKRERGMIRKKNEKEEKDESEEKDLRRWKKMKVNKRLVEIKIDGRRDGKRKDWYRKKEKDKGRIEKKVIIEMEKKKKKGEEEDWDKCIGKEIEKMKKIGKRNMS